MLQSLFSNKVGTHVTSLFPFSFNEGLVDIMAPSVRLVGKPRLVFARSSTNGDKTKKKQEDAANDDADEKRQNLTWHKIIEVDRGMSFEQAVRVVTCHL